jgi:hypothetical protein
VDCGVPRDKIVELDWWQERLLDQNLMVAATPAQHFSGRGITDRNKTLWASWVIKTPFHKVFFIGDSGYLFLSILFLWFKVYPMAWFNFMFSVPVFVFSYFINHKGVMVLLFPGFHRDTVPTDMLGVFYWVGQRHAVLVDLSCRADITI